MRMRWPRWPTRRRGSYADMASLWLRMAPLYFARWDESYRAALAAGAVGSSVEPGKAFNIESRRRPSAAGPDHGADARRRRQR